MTVKKKIIKSRPKKLVVSLPTSLYETDFVKWTKTQVQLLRKGNIKELDIDNLVEEIESLGTSDKKALWSHTIILLLHLLKEEYQPEGKGNSNSWDASIVNARVAIKLLLEDNPSLKNELKKTFPQAYARARKEAARETKCDINKFPAECPWSIEAVFPFFKFMNKMSWKGAPYAHKEKKSKTHNQSRI